MQDELSKGVKARALEINLNPQIYGTIAEIGAGQEVARNFFQAGGASGTVAKTLCAYDMIISDTIYGKEESGRYVCESRLDKMLKREFDQITERLAPHRSQETTFFAFADTTATTSYKSEKEGHGWLGVRFQHEHKGTPSDLIIHTILKDRSPTSQQSLIGVLGVNMIYSCFYHRDGVKELVAGIIEQLDPERIHIDMIKVRGEAFNGFDNRLLSLELLKQNFSEAVFFSAQGEVFQPSADLYKKPIMVLRGSFRPPTLVSQDMLERGMELYRERFGAQEIIPIAEITMNNLASWGDYEGEDFLARVDLLAAMNLRVMISNHTRHYRVSSYYKRFTDKPVAIVLGLYNLKELLDEKNYQDLEGGLMQSFGVLINNEDTIFVYPYQEKGEKILRARDLEVPGKYKFLYQHLLENNIIVDIPNPKKEILHIYSRRVMDMITSGSDEWEVMVPAPVVETIKKSCLFGACELPPAKS